MMGEHLVLHADQLVTNKSLNSSESVDASCSHATDVSIAVNDTNEDVKYDSDGEKEPLIQSVECRICQEEDTIKNLEVPCACSGSLKFAHRKCVQRWCDEKGDTICEICHKAYEPGYTAPPRSEDTILDISASWTVHGTPLDLNDPRLLAMAAAEQNLLDTEYDEYEDTSVNGAAFCRSAALILMALLLLRHALTIGDGDDDDDDGASAFFALFMLRAAGFLLPCYIMAWAISILQRRRQVQEAERLAGLAAAADVAFMMQAGQHRGLQVTIAPGPAMAPPPPVLAPPPAVGLTHQPFQ
ncbi:putative E3 ubiquitin-protein ligase MARCH [Helianthus annuus]|uniref:E3 ubiquitin-protein ligase MARCH n=2 Tax=Helianthus annuus TaxID=4232 RepID=A0A251VEG8_HELAN|nr:putative E3 ubiquitin-protein ligase MARCH [Helianthus annuus]KAJ0604556.1 putative E3 ubiquitin-protein ligase MARCH [Helianthus annuus]KAJ0615057.1 putative E3 ubiquitin-protein ligase MARCH [Helianthus annuus]KAJ0951545.1 putative E3 ubiquitin-protein ligase MARCH [Helianthus annuus]